MHCRRKTLLCLRLGRRFAAASTTRGASQLRARAAGVAGAVVAADAITHRAHRRRRRVALIVREGTAGTGVVTGVTAMATVVMVVVVVMMMAGGEGPGGGGKARRSGIAEDTLAARFAAAALWCVLYGGVVG